MWNLVPYVSVMMLARATELSRRGHLAVLAAVVALVSLRQRRMEREADEPQGEVTAREPIEDPTLQAALPRAIDPGQHGPFREASALLGGVVRKENGVPISHAFITVLGDDGRQLPTTRTDDQGRYAAADLLEEFAVVVLLVQGHAPAAARLLARPGHPLRQDFDLVGASSASSRPAPTEEVLTGRQLEHP